MKGTILKYASKGVVLVDTEPRLDLAVIKEKRKSLGLTHQALAEELSFKNASTYFKYETGTYAFKADHLPKLASVLQCDLNDLFTKK